MRIFLLLLPLGLFFTALQSLADTPLLVRWSNNVTHQTLPKLTPIKATRGWKLCALYPNLKDAYWLSINYGMVKQARASGVALKIFEAGGYQQLATQREQLSHCQRWGADAILLSSSVAQFPGLTESLGETPAVEVVNAVRDGASRTRVGVAWYQMGYIPGRYLATHQKQKQLNVLLMPGPKEAGGSMAMEQGFRQATMNSDIHIVNVAYGDNDLEIQRNQLQSMLEKHPQIDVVAGTAIAAEVAMGEARNRQQPLGIVSFYLSHQVYRGLKRNRIIMAVSDQMVLQGELAVSQAIRILQHQPVVDNLSPNILLLTPENVSQQKVASSLSPLGFRPVYALQSTSAANR
jgi:protein TorT